MGISTLRFIQYVNAKNPQQQSVFLVPVLYVMIVLKGSIPIAFGGTEQPAAYGELVSIGGLNADVNKKLSAAVAAILETKLSIPKSRFFLKFYDTKASPSKSRKCTVSSCFTPVIDLMVLSLGGMAPPFKQL
ncbi:hypothetical protein E3N88_35540 [Mikania micrantha]|uniref:Macrophage migration inhibitory factor n=1 Tax=Mikania micrantha TaxID=192012 RepID=A0A5N6M174_9ASTR|nr:hypothetical protein E3N88_35540 [Mikania micrantha]